MKATVNENATHATRRLIGQELEVVGPGANELHRLVRRPGEKRIFGLPTSWLDFPAEAVPETPRCPCCGQELPKEEP